MMFTDDQRLFDSMRTGPSSRLHTTSSTGRTRPDERKLRIALVMLSRTRRADHDDRRHADTHRRWPPAHAGGLTPLGVGDRS